MIAARLGLSQISAVLAANGAFYEPATLVEKTITIGRSHEEDVCFPASLPSHRYSPVVAVANGRNDLEDDVGRVILGELPLLPPQPVHASPFQPIQNHVELVSYGRPVNLR